MKLAELITAASKFYPDNYLLHYFDVDNERILAGQGDTLALFIVQELVDTFDPDADDDSQINEAIVRVDAAVRELQAVSHGLMHFNPLKSSS
jgi:hypothetical protein